MKRLYGFLLLAMVAVIFSFGLHPSRAAGTDYAVSSSASYLASSQWISGTVEGTETDGKYQYVHLNGIRYRMMTQASIARRVPRNGSAFDEVPATFEDVHTDREVMLRVQGFRIYQILIME